MFHRPVFAALAVAAVLAAAPAAATESVVSFDFTRNTNSALYGTAGNALTFTSTAVAGQSVSVRATAWTATYSNSAKGYVVSSAYLGWYAGGLGVTAASPKDDSKGANNTHEIDNVKSVDFILFQANKDIDLSSITKNVYGVYDTNGRVSYDSDASVAYGQTTSDWSSGYNLTGAVFSSKALPTTLADNATHKSSYTGSAAVSVEGHYNLWAVGAAYTTSGNDGFKLAGMTVGFKPYVAPPGAVPEPATWGMMILGFGMVGMAMRRRTTTLRQVTA